MSFVRRHFRRREDPYAGADMARALRLSAALWIVGVVITLALLPVAPPTRAIGEAGWVVAALIVAASLAAAVRALGRWKVGFNEMYLQSFGALVGIAGLEWLAGGRSSPYHQLFLLSALYTACANPPRRYLAYLPAFLVAVAAPFAYAPFSAAEAGDAALQVLITVGFATLGNVLMDSVRAQRVEMEARGHADRLAAETDPLTALGNRRALMAHLEEHAARASSENPVVLAIFDLDGFKAYNDSFGHPAGDALLTRIAQRLEAAVADEGRAYRMGGDEFCVLAHTTPAQALELIETAAAALEDEGDGFSIGAARGTALIPADTADPNEALRIADTRMYARKSLSRTSAGRQSADVLLSVLSERDPESGGHVDDVSELCVEVGRALGLDEGELPALRAAGALHDIGKLAIPDAILSKPGPLTEAEWEFVRRHTVIGERILRAAPALAPVGPLIRSSHEHFDGGGYPDGLSGEEIPLASRIVSVCDAFGAMTSQRPYRTAMSAEGALEELRACTGTQFDPMVVAALEKVLRDRSDDEESRPLPFAARRALDLQ
jgi:diguanylate cyclase (GGDEF)-like protein